MTINSDAKVYLSPEGNSIEIEVPYNRPSIQHLQKKAIECRTHEQVLAILEEIKQTPELTDSLVFCHYNNIRYDRHVGSWPRGIAHYCLLDTQIDFVRYKIAEATHGSRQTLKRVCLLL